MYNNDVTYHKKWDTPENRGFLAKLEKKYFPRILCSSDCPLSWSQEVYMLLKHLDEKYGIRWTDHTIQGYSISNPNNILKRVFLQPFLDVYDNVFKTGPIHEKTPTWKADTMRKSWNKKLPDAPGIFWHSLSYGLRTAGFQLRARFFNFIRKPKLGIDQVKEKYGTLRVYFGVDSEIDNEYINMKIKEVEKALSRKGAYYDIKEDDVEA